MRRRITRLKQRAGIKPPAFIPFEAEIARYRRAKFQKYPPDALNYALPWVRDFVCGLGHGEASLIGRMPESELKKVRVRQRARLIARQIGMPIEDIHIVI